jgi:hypothetical protein
MYANPIPSRPLQQEGHLSTCSPCKSFTVGDVDFIRNSLMMQMKTRHSTIEIDRSQPGIALHCTIATTAIKLEDECLWDAYRCGYYGP